MKRKKRVMIACYLDGLANSIRPLKIQKYLKKKDFEVILIDTLSHFFRTAKYNFYNFWKKRMGNSRLRYFEQFPLLADMALTAEVLLFLMAHHKYDAIICEDIKTGYLFLKDIGCLKILDLAAPWSVELENGYELYKKGLIDKKDINYSIYTRLNNDYLNKMRKTELKIYKSADHFSFHWHGYTDYVKQYIYDGNNLFRLDWGCSPKRAKAKWNSNVKIINLGYLGEYWVNKNLISYLTKLKVYPIHCYGKPKPIKHYGLTYKGYLSNSRFSEIIPMYQFGLVTITKDKLRRYGFSSKSFEYMSWALPVLMPEWRHSCPEEGHIFYNESRFIDVVKQFKTKQIWKAKSDEAYNYAQEHTWDKQLNPLLRILND